MKVGMMKPAIGLVIALLCLVNCVICSSIIIASCIDESPSPSEFGLQGFKTKLAETLGSINQGKGSGSDLIKANLSESNSSAMNTSGLQTSRVAQDSLKFNQSEENDSTSFGQAGCITILEKDPGRSSLADNESAMPIGVRSDNRSSLGGFWSMQSRKQGAGRNSIDDRIVLSGDFDVKKSVSFFG
jgi:hypothetical protein